MSSTFVDVHTALAARSMVKKLSAQELEEFKQALLHLRGELSGDIRRLEADAFDTDGEKASVDNPADIGSESFSQEFNLELLQRDESTLSEVEEAIDRLKSGQFGKCESCDAPIPKERLKAVPYARNCVVCQRKVERSR